MAHITIVLATYNPDWRFFEEQIQSIRNQTYSNWKCLVTDDSSSEYAGRIREFLAGDSRFEYHVNSGTKGSVFNFEHGLSLVSPSCELVALCDQDDVWEPEKLEKTVMVFADSDVQLVHHDLRLIDSSGGQIHPSCWQLEQRDLASTPRDLLFRNSVTGCSSLFRTGLLNSALPFASQKRPYFYHHDQWIALVASLRGTIRVIPEPLVRYRQHGGNVVGAYLKARRSMSDKIGGFFRIAEKSQFAYASRWQLAQDLKSRFSGEDRVTEASSCVESWWCMMAYLVPRMFTNRIWFGISLQMALGCWVFRLKK
jgi:glycosyltransferase involved in cell wall biosynthesis